VSADEPARLFARGGFTRAAQTDMAAKRPDVELIDTARLYRGE
jgi:hypothetical protein